MVRTCKVSAENYCRVCKADFRTRVGNFNKIVHASSQNVFKPSQRKESFGVVLSETCANFGVSLKNSSDHSSKVCLGCSKKILKANQLLAELKCSLNAVHEKFSKSIEAGAETDKRKLLTPDRGASPAEPKSRRVAGSPAQKKPNKNSRKCLFESETEDTQSDDGIEHINPNTELSSIEEKQIDDSDRSKTARPDPRPVFDNPDEVLNKLNIDGLKSCEGRSWLKLKVVLVHPNGKVDVRNPTNGKTVQIIRNIVDDNWTAVANAVFTHEEKELQQALQLALRRKVNREFKEFSKFDSVLKGTQPEGLAAFSNKLVVTEARVHCPFWDASVRGATGVRDTTTCINQLALVTAIVSRTRNPKMSAAAYRISNMLIHNGGTSFQDITRLSKLGICMSPVSTIEMQRKMGKNFDAKVLQWKSIIEDNKRCIRLLEQALEMQKPPLDEESMELEFSFDLNEETLKSYTSYSRNVYEKVMQSLAKLSEHKNEICADDQIYSEEVLQEAIHCLKGEKLPYYKIVADNVDLEIMSRIQSKKRGNRSIHWTHQYALLDKVSLPSPGHDEQRPKGEIQFIDLLPSAQVQENLVNRMAVLVGRVVTKYLKVFKPLSKVAVYHIPHQFSKEMEKKSNSCCLSVEFLNPNIAGEMAQLMKKNQSQYVPLSPDGTSVVTTIPFHGDQNLEERSRNVKWTFQDGECSAERLEGLDPEFADWHAKFTLYKSENKLFVNHASVGESCTSMASMNRTGKTNASKSIDSHYNEYSEFHTCEVEAHICAAFMTKMQMSKMDDNPNVILPQNSVPKSIQGKWLHDLCCEFVNEYVFQSNDFLGLVNKTADLQTKSKPPFQCRVDGCDRSYLFHSARVSHEIKQHNETVCPYQGDDRDDLGHYFCRCSCNFVFSTTTTRNRHERKEHQSIESADTSDETLNDETMTDNAESKSAPLSTEDYIFNYHQAKIAFGLVLFEFNDCIKEGDGERLFQLYKSALLLFKNYGHTKYSYAVLLYLTKINYILSDQEAFTLKWNRFYNHHGGKGRNIPLDLRKEQQNRILKTMWRAVGSNLNERSAARISNSLELQEMLLQSLDQDCELPQRKGYRSNPDKLEAVSQITSDLMEKNVFTFTSGRAGHPSFPEFKANSIDLDYRDLHHWIKEHLKLWESIYQFKT